MKRILSILFTVICGLACLQAQTVGLVLSGGGAKGIAHIGIIKALEENNVPIDYVAGTSMGAIVGAWYAMGYTPDEMLDLILSEDFNLWSRGIFDKRYVYYFKKPDPTPEIVTFNVALQDSTKFEPHFLPNSLINPFPMNYAFMSIFAPYSAQCEGNFDNLFVPFRAVASDVYHKREVILRNGDLGDAVRASMSFPFVFKPIEIDSVLVYDGGIYNNFPVDVMKSDFNPDIIIGSIVAAKLDKPKEDDLMNQIENMVMQKSDYTLDPEDGILMRFNLSDVGLLDFPKARQIAKIGYDRTIAMMDSIKSRIPRELSQDTRQLQRMVFKSKTPDLVFDKVSVEGGNHQQREYIRRQFDSDEPFSDEQAKAAYYKTISDGKISDLIPHARYDKESGMFNLDIKAKVHDQLAIGMGGFISSTSSNQIYIGAHYRTVSLNSLDLDLGGPRGHWQFYHPPLHHMISALWLWLSEHVFGISNAAAQESLQTLSLFYAMAIVITAYRILRHFRLEGIALYVPLAVVAFHPSFILFSGSINNDALSVVFILGAVLWTLKWYEKQTWEGIVKIALCIGLGMMTKLSAAMVAIPVAAVFLVVALELPAFGDPSAAAEKLADPRAARRICSDLFPAGAVVSGAESGAVRRTADLCAGNAGKLCAVSGGTVVSLADPGLFAASGGKRFRTVGTANRRQLQRV